MAERILIVDDSAGTREALTGILEDEGYEVVGVGTGAEARDLWKARSYDLVFLDLVLPDADGMELLDEALSDHVDLPIIVVSGHGNVDLAVRATRLGAYDFLEKPLALERVMLTVHNALDRRRMRREIEQLSHHLYPTELVGDSPAMRRLTSELERAGPSDSRILLMGENGTGKELAARRAHQLSARAHAPFVDVNCAAIPEELIESELFGHRKGAFTGATSDRTGRFQQAHRGTLFLDEVADMSLKTQAKVLRALQEQRFERVGGSEPIQVDVRVVAATNKDLEEEIQEGRFREDLYFRLAVIPIQIPPLRERREDVPRLVEHFAGIYARQQGRRPKSFTEEAMARLQSYGWPGNVRELRNFVERMMIMAPGHEITARDLPTPIKNADGPPLDELLDVEDADLREARAAFEKRFIERRLAEHRGNVSRTAEVLGLERSHLYRKIKAYDIEIPR